MNSKILLLSVAVVAVGLFAMPSTLSLFAGQHTFYNGESVDCKKCHLDIYNEMSSGVSTAHVNPALKECQGCHKSTKGTNFTGNVPYNSTLNISFYQNITANPNAHAAVTLECVNCHQGVPAELVGSQEAHTKYYQNSTTSVNSTAFLETINQTVIDLKGANTACVGCHTHALINITWTRSMGYNMTVNGTGGSWTMQFSMNNNQNVSYSGGN